MKAMQSFQRALSAPYCSKIGCCVYANNINMAVLCLNTQAVKKSKKHVITSINRLSLSMLLSIQIFFQ